VLAISRSIVELQGGLLWATSNDGRGMTFHLTLPVTDAQSAAATRIRFFRRATADRVNGESAYGRGGASTDCSSTLPESSRNLDGLVFLEEKIRLYKLSSIP
jgi:hypothetical protein